MPFSHRLTSLPGYPMAEIPAIKRRLLGAGVDVIDVGAGDNDTPPPAPVVEAMREALLDPRMSKYGFQQGLPEFRRAAADYLARRFGQRFDPATEILPLIGSKDGLAHLPFAFVDPGDVVIVPEPGYQAYLGGAMLAGGTPEIYPLRESEGYLLELGTVAPAVLARTRLVNANYPNNPTAAVADLAYLERLVDGCRRAGAVLAYDNAYCDLTFDGYRAPSIFEVAGRARPGPRVLLALQELLDDRLAARLRGRGAGADRRTHPDQVLHRHRTVPGGTAGGRGGAGARRGAGRADPGGAGTPP